MGTGGWFVLLESRSRSSLGFGLAVYQFTSDSSLQHRREGGHNPGRVGDRPAGQVQRHVEVAPDEHSLPGYGQQRDGELVRMHWQVFVSSRTTQRSPVSASDMFCKNVCWFLSRPLWSRFYCVTAPRAWEHVGGKKRREYNSLS